MLVRYLYHLSMSLIAVVITHASRMRYLVARNLIDVYAEDTQS